MKAKIKPLYRATLLGLLGVATTYATTAQAAQCEHVVKNEWNSGFVAEISITNDGTAPINGWDVKWSYDNASLVNLWNAKVSGSRSLSASNLDWNRTINPGQSVVFGLVGKKSMMNGPTPTATVTGDVCGELTVPVTDTDNDGVKDNIDQCANTPIGDEVDSVGCTIPDILDSDNDGIVDSVDQCPSTPVGDKVNAVGCTIPMALDSDNDGVVDSVDKCPETPEGKAVDATGCEVDQVEVPGIFRIDNSGNVTKSGETLPMNCVSWFGLEGQHEPKDAENNADGAPMELYMGNMWWANQSQGTGRTVEQTMKEIVAQGVKVIRLPIAPQTLDATNEQGIGDIQNGGVLKNHASVRQDNARQAMTDFIIAADKNDLNVIIDIHSCSNYLGWRAGDLEAKPPYVDADRKDYNFDREGYSCGTDVGDGVTVQEYNQDIWLDNLREIAGLSKELGVDNIIGVDIFNEPWNYTWSEWKTLAESAYGAISSVNDDMLIIVEGVGAVKADGTEVAHGLESHTPNWGENLYGMKDDPLNIPKNRLILSPHTYGPSVFVQNHFLDQNQAGCEGLEGDEAGEANCNIVIDPDYLALGWDDHFGYLRDQGYAVVVGEFGGSMDWPLSASPYYAELWKHASSTVDKEWQTALVDYMGDKGIQACYWSLNPESADTGGLFEHAHNDSNEAGWGEWLDFNKDKLSLLHKLWKK